MVTLHPPPKKNRQKIGYITLSLCKHTGDRQPCFPGHPTSAEKKKNPTLSTFILMFFYIHNHAISMGFLEDHRSRFLNYDVFLSLKIVI